MNGVVIITGASRGIGAATALAAAKAGLRVGVNFVQDEAAAGTVVAAVRTFGVEAVAVRADVSIESEVGRMFDVVADALGPVTALVSNAGMTGRIGRFENVRVETLQRVLDVNLLGCMLCAREAVRRMSTANAGPGGAIVNVSSIAATTGSPEEYVHYAAAKAGVEALTVGLAKEVARNDIRVNAVAPGSTLTGIHAAAGEPGRPQRITSRIPMGRLAEPREIADAIVWLLSSEATYVSGAILRVAGGL